MGRSAGRPRRGILTQFRKDSGSVPYRCDPAAIVRRRDETGTDADPVRIVYAGQRVLGTVPVAYLGLCGRYRETLPLWNKASLQITRPSLARWRLGSTRGVPG